MPSKRENIISTIETKLKNNANIKTVTRKLSPPDKYQNYEFPIIYLKDSAGDIEPGAQGQNEAVLKIDCFVIDRERENKHTRTNELIELIEQILVPNNSYETLSLGLPYVYDINIEKQPDLDESMIAFQNLPNAIVSVVVKYYYDLGSP